MNFGKTHHHHADRTIRTPTPLGSLSLRRNFSWTFAGNVVYAAASWGMLVVLAKLGTPEMVGQFALGLAVTAPVIMLSNLQLRAIQATDAKHDYSFGDYLGLRLLMTLIALLAIGGIGLASPYRAETTLVILIIGVGKCFDSMSDIYRGFLQQRERMDYIAKSMIFNGVFSLIALATMVHITRSVLWGAVGWAIVSAANLFLYTIPVTARFAQGSPSADARRVSLRPRFHRATLFQLARLALPLGLVMMLISLNTNIPRYFIENHLGERELGIFAAIAYLMVAGTTVVSALGQSVSPRLAVYYSKGNIAAFRRILFRLTGLVTALGIAGIIVSLAGGSHILALFYGEEYANHGSLLVEIAIASALWFIASILGCGATARRRLQFQPLALAFVVVVSTFSCLKLLPVYGLRGASISMILASITGVVLFSMLALHKTRKIGTY